MADRLLAEAAAAVGVVALPGADEIAVVQVPAGWPLTVVRGEPGDGDLTETFVPDPEEARWMIVPGTGITGEDAAVAVLSPTAGHIGCRGTGRARAVWAAAARIISRRPVTEPAVVYIMCDADDGMAAAGVRVTVP